MPRTTARGTALQNLLGMVRPQPQKPGVIATLKPEPIPDSDFGPGGHILESEGSHLMPGSGNVRPYTGPKRERLSDAPNFKYTSMQEGPIPQPSDG